MKLTLFFLLNRLVTWLKSHDKNLDILRTKSAFDVKQKAFFFIFKGFSAAKNGLKLESAPLNFRYRVSFEQGVPWHSGNYGV